MRRHGKSPQFPQHGKFTGLAAIEDCGQKVGNETTTNGALVSVAAQKFFIFNGLAGTPAGFEPMAPGLRIPAPYRLAPLHKNRAKCGLFPQGDCADCANERRLKKTHSARTGIDRSAQHEVIPTEP